MNQILKKNISTTFGKPGEEWLEKLPSVIDSLVRKWELKELSPVKNLSYNYVCTAHSPEYGPVILKAGFGSGENNREWKALQLLKESSYCFRIDEKHNVMLLKRVLPGENLYSLKSFEDQIRKGALLLKNQPCIKRSDDKSFSEFPTYDELFKKTASFIRKENRGGELLLSGIDRAEGYLHDFLKRYKETFLLHGDYHHQNILPGENNQWEIIDPKGVWGFFFADTGRFLFNQMRVIPEGEQNLYTEISARIFSEELGIAQVDVIRMAYLECILAYCWFFEEFMSDNEYEAKKNQLKKELNPYIEYLEKYDPSF